MNSRTTPRLYTLHYSIRSPIRRALCSTRLNSFLVDTRLPEHKQFLTQFHPSREVGTIWSMNEEASNEHSSRSKSQVVKKKKQQINSRTRERARTHRREEPRTNLDSGLLLIPEGLCSCSASWLLAPRILELCVCG